MRSTVRRRVKSRVTFIGVPSGKVLGPAMRIAATCVDHMVRLSVLVSNGVFTVWKSA